MTRPETALEDDTPIQINHRGQILTLVVVLLGMLLAALDQTIVGTAMPRIIGELIPLRRTRQAASPAEMLADVGGEPVAVES
jgi:hypothetical protein